MLLYFTLERDWYNWYTIRLWAGHWINHDSTPWRDTRFFSAPKHPDQKYGD